MEKQRKILVWIGCMKRKNDGKESEKSFENETSFGKKTKEEKF